jgi:hypothetical protein
VLGFEGVDCVEDGGEVLVARERGAWGCAGDGAELEVANAVVQEGL